MNDHRHLLNPVARAESACARLDECLKRSPLRAGVLNRLVFEEARAAIHVEGGLVTIEDLVLRDHDADVHAPTQELERAATILGAVRKAVERRPDDLLTLSGARALAGSWKPKTVIAPKPTESGLSQSVLDLLAFTEALEREADLPATKITNTPAEPTQTDDTFDRWLDRLREVRLLPPTLAAAELIQSWNELAPIPKQHWVGRVLASIYLRREGLGVIVPLHLGLKRQRLAERRETLADILAQIEIAAQEGLNIHSRLVQAKAVMGLRLKGRRRSSKLGRLVDLMLDQPLVTTAIVRKKLGVTAPGAGLLLDQVGSSAREITGRGQYRAWAVAL